jgi:hypothetical protein
MKGVVLLEKGVAFGRQEIKEKESKRKSLKREERAREQEDKETDQLCVEVDAGRGQFY